MCYTYKTSFKGLFKKKKQLLPVAVADENNDENGQIRRYLKRFIVF